MRQQLYVEATPARRKVQGLVEAGASVRAIARASGVSAPAVAHLLAGRSRIQRRTAQAFDDVSLRDIYRCGSGTVPSVGARRRVQALMALGWRAEDLQDRGIGTQNLLHRGGRCSTRTYVLVCEVYDQLSMTPGLSQETRRRALAAGYAPPLAWDEDSLDDPSARPAAEAVRPSATKRSRPGAEVLEDIEWLLEVEPSMTSEEIALRLGCTRSGVQAAVTRSGREDLRQQLARNGQARNHTAA